MPHRYAVLSETSTDRRARPVGLVVEQDDHVLVEARDDLCVPVRYDAPFTVGGPDMTVVQYTPRDPQYFDQVVLDLSRAFAVSTYGMVTNATEGVILDLLNKWVLRPMRENHVVAYHGSVGKYPAVKRYRQKYYTGAPAPSSAPAAAAAAAAVRTSGDLVGV